MINSKKKMSDSAMPERVSVSVKHHQRPAEETTNEPKSNAEPQQSLECTTRVTEKPPPGPVKRKKKLEKSLVDLSCNPKMEQKRQKISDDKSTVRKTAIAPKAPTETQTQSFKAKELQNHTLFKLKRKNEETNAALVQKLNAYTDQLRLEINGLKTALLSEKNAVRALR